MKRTLRKNFKVIKFFIDGNFQRQSRGRLNKEKLLYVDGINNFRDSFPFVRRELV